MQGVDGNKYHISPMIHQLNHLMHPAKVVLHLHQTAEYAHTMVYMHHKISQVESA